jgi:hypothetical protein
MITTHRDFKYVFCSGSKFVLRKCRSDQPVAREQQVAQPNIWNSNKSFKHFPVKAKI